MVDTLANKESNDLLPSDKRTTTNSNPSPPHTQVRQATCGGGGAEPGGFESRLKLDDQDLPASDDEENNTKITGAAIALPPTTPSTFRLDVDRGGLYFDPEIHTGWATNQVHAQGLRLLKLEKAANQRYQQELALKRPVQERVCDCCNQVFPSKTQLMKHLRSPGIQCAYVQTAEAGADGDDTADLLPFVCIEATSKGKKGTFVYQRDDGGNLVPAEGDAAVHIRMFADVFPNTKEDARGIELVAGKKGWTNAMHGRRCADGRTIAMDEAVDSMYGRVTTDVTFWAELEAAIMKGDYDCIHVSFPPNEGGSNVRAHALVCCPILDALVKHAEMGGFFTIENPRISALWTEQWFADFVRATGAHAVDYDGCSYNETSEKLTTIVTNLSKHAVSGLSRACAHDRWHRHNRPLAGGETQGRLHAPVSKAGGVYTPELCDALADAYVKGLEQHIRIREVSLRGSGDGEPTFNTVDTAADLHFISVGEDGAWVTEGTNEATIHALMADGSGSQIKIVTAMTVATTRAGEEVLLVGHRMAANEASSQSSLLDPTCVHCAGGAVTIDIATNTGCISIGRHVLDLTTCGTGLGFHSRKPTLVDMDEERSPKLEHVYITPPDKYSKRAALMNIGALRRVRARESTRGSSRGWVPRATWSLLHQDSDGLPRTWPVLRRLARELRATTTETDNTTALTETGDASRRAHLTSLTTASDRQLGATTATLKTTTGASAATTAALRVLRLETRSARLASYRVLKGRHNFDRRRMGNIPKEAFERTLDVSTQYGTHRTTAPTRVKRTPELSYRRRLREAVATDDLPLAKFDLPDHEQKKWTGSGYRYVQVYVECGDLMGNNPSNRVTIFPMRKKSEFNLTLQAFIANRGIPLRLQADNAPQESRGAMLLTCLNHGIGATKRSEPYKQWQNTCENTIGTLKARGKEICNFANLEYGFVLQPRHNLFLLSHLVDIVNHTWTATTAWARPADGGTTPLEASGDCTPDLSHFRFPFGCPVVCRRVGGAFGESVVDEGWALGAAPEGNFLCTYVLCKRTNRVISRSEVMPKSKFLLDDTAAIMITAADENEPPPTITEGVMGPRPEDTIDDRDPTTYKRQAVTEAPDGCPRIGYNLPLKSKKGAAKANDYVNSTIEGYSEDGELAFISYKGFPHWGTETITTGELRELLPKGEHGSGDESQPELAESYSLVSIGGYHDNCMNKSKKPGARSKKSGARSKYCGKSSTERNKYNKTKDNVLYLRAHWGAEFDDTWQPFDELREDQPDMCATYINSLGGRGKAHGVQTLDLAKMWAEEYEEAKKSKRRSARRLQLLDELASSGLFCDPPAGGFDGVRVRQLLATNEITDMNEAQLRRISRTICKQGSFGVLASDVNTTSTHARNLERLAKLGVVEGARVMNGIKCPQNFEEMERYDRENKACPETQKLLKGQTWKGAMTSENCTKLVTEFKAIVVQPEGTAMPPGYQEMKFRFVFTCSADFVLKCRCCARGDLLDVDDLETTLTTVGGRSTKMLLAIADHEDLGVAIADIRSAYVTCAAVERCWVSTLPKEFGEHAGKPGLVKGNLYGLSTAGATFHIALQTKLETAGWKKCDPQDPSVFMRTNDDGSYSYVATYVDDLLIVGKDTESIVKEIEEMYSLKHATSVEATDVRYIGATLSRAKSRGLGREYITSHMGEYVREAMRHIVGHLEAEKARGRTTYVLKDSGCGPAPGTRSRITTLPLGFGDQCEEVLDTGESTMSGDEAQLMDEADTKFYQTLIGAAMWVANTVRIDVAVAVSRLARYTHAPRVGHGNRVLRLWAYLRDYPDRWINMNGEDLPRASQEFTANKRERMRRQYGEAVEVRDPRDPDPRGVSMSLTAYVDSDLGSCHETRRSRTGFLILLGKALIEWKTMMQVGAEHSSYGAELRALSRACLAVVGARLHLRSFGIEPSGPSVIYIDNASALFAASTLATTLRLRHLCIDYTFVRECVAAGIIEPEKVASRDNLSDILTKDTDEETFWRLTTTMMEGAGTSVDEAKLGRLARLSREDIHGMLRQMVSSMNERSVYH